MASDAHRRLRAATHDVHQALEDGLDLVERVRARAGRAAVAAAFYRLHAEIEAAVQPWLGDLQGLDFEARRRTPALRRDLAVLGAEPPAAEPHAVAAGSLGEALGLMYVLEGSTLGGQVIRKQAPDMAGLGFLDPYGRGTGERWRAFLAVLEGALRTPAEVEAAVAGALAGFGHAQRRLVQGQTAHV